MAPTTRPTTGNPGSGAYPINKWRRSITFSIATNSRAKIASASGRSRRERSPTVTAAKLGRTSWHSSRTSRRMVCPCVLQRPASPPPDSKRAVGRVGHLLAGLLWLLLGLTSACRRPMVRPSDESGVERLPDESAFAHQENVVPYTPYAERRRHRTRLRPATVAAHTSGVTVPDEFVEVAYPSAGRNLRAWYAAPLNDRPVPGVVYLHNDFALTEESFSNHAPFVSAGFAVVLPTYRGENGNAGAPELLYGEVDDARAAATWLAARPEVQAGSMYVIGHSIGGAIAALMSLYPEPPLRGTANIGGIYRAHTFHHWARRRDLSHLVRFDVADDSEVALRLLIANLPDVHHPHRSYAGRADEFDMDYSRHAAGLARAHGVPVVHIPVAGDHMSSAIAAVQDYIRSIREQETRDELTTNRGE